MKNIVNATDGDIQLHYVITPKSIHMFYFLFSICERWSKTEKVVKLNYD